MPFGCAVSKATLLSKCDWRAPVTSRRISVALPTYRRPELLRRALASLVAQTHADWTAHVFDDSPDCEGAKVVSAFDDGRIRYTANSQRAGAAINIDRCFGNRLGPGPGLAMILEDDNYLLPGFLELAVEEMSLSQAWMGLFNQRVHDEDSGLAPTSTTTRGAWFSSGWVSPLELHASLLLMEGLSNGGIVWRLDCGERLAVGDAVLYSGLHEACRSLLVRRAFWFCSESLAVWTRNRPAESARKDERNRVVSRGQQSVTRAVLARHGQAAVRRALGWCRDRTARQVLVSNLLHGGFWTEALQVDAKLAMQSWAKVCKGIASRWLVEDPCGEFMRTLPQHTV